MALPKFIACDFGAESGRLILGTIEQNKISLEEIHRFPNRQVKVFGHIYWDLLYLFDELKKGLSQAVSRGHKRLSGIGVDTWGVDFGLIGRDKQILGNPYAYRDSRTDGMMEVAFQQMSKDEIYQVTGIQFMQLNTLYQLLSMVKNQHPLFDIAQKLLFMPDLFNFLMTGEVVSEYTIASTSQMLDAVRRDWSDEIFEKLGLPRKIMANIIPPGTVIGKLLPEIVEDTGLEEVDIIAPAGHDTANAVAAVPGWGENWAYLSSGTWSLLGIEVDKPIITNDSLRNNFTNEGGVNNKIRFLRNNMGMWLLERCRFIWRKEGTELSYSELIDLAKDAAAFKCIIDPDDPSFLNPPNMLEAIANFCQRTGQSIPTSRGEFVRCILESLALKYRYIVDKINSMRQPPIQRLHIVGGGSKNELLNQFSANALGIPVVAGPVEATAIGNILMQAIAKNVLNNIEEGRELVSRSFPMKHYEPQNRDAWEEAYQQSKKLFNY